YPAIYRLAMDILPVQGTSIPSECVFSSAGETDTNCCNCLSSEMLQALQVLKFGIRTRGTLDFTCGLTYTEELEHLEALMNEEFSVPTDIRAYVNSIHAFETFVMYYFYF
ncbi:hypothetical protein GYMLUDRAFT_176368, partial [Collybiopsis luxurians FD-317 M1]